ncbi:hypothetical protein [Shouchella clausii]|uniref:hypothetical protein n=1 Tax=Shouchella clausii TaxID=79880 RepID=UPI000BA713D8|nr:hypothetical protein [Shouchella clausii]PAD17415.1 hypothetical protein CHH74_01965 [Shouchella clausii]
MINSLDNDSFFALLVTIIATLTLLTYTASMVNLTKKHRKMRYEEFHSKLSKTEKEESFMKLIKHGIEEKKIENLDDLLILYSAHFNEIESTSARNSISFYLKRYLLDLHDKDNELEHTRFLELKDKIYKLIDENEKIFPFTILPEEEQSKMKDILEFIESNNPDSAKRKLIDLSILMSIKDKHLKRMEMQLDKVTKLNKWSVPLAIISLIVTIAFGIFTL